MRNGSTGDVKKKTGNEAKSFFGAFFFAFFFFFFFVFFFRNNVHATYTTLRTTNTQKKNEYNGAHDVDHTKRIHLFPEHDFEEEDFEEVYDY
jgi:hypothetical protein